MTGFIDNAIPFLGCLLQLSVVVCSLYRREFLRYFFLNIYMLASASVWQPRSREAHILEPGLCRNVASVEVGNQRGVRVLTLAGNLTTFMMCPFARYKSARCGKKKVPAIRF